MNPADLCSPEIPRLVVSGHPNHELAIFGFVQRARPRLLFLTDGGSERREDESRRALEAIHLLDRARFLSVSEKELYGALLDRDTKVFAAIAASVRDEIVASGIRQVVCESVEFYNPLHDLTLPIVMAASRGTEGIDIVEFPLISQISASPERYSLQRFAEPRDVIEFHPTREERAAKLAARDEHYRSLRHQLGSLLAELDERHLAVEIFAPAAAALPVPGGKTIPRYDLRGRLLQARGDFERAITHEEHFSPVVADLLRPPEQRSSFDADGSR